MQRTNCWLWLSFVLVSLFVCRVATSGPIHDAVRKGNREGIEQALKVGSPDRQLNSLDEAGFTPLDLSVKRRDKALLEYLLDKGSQIQGNMVFSQQTPLHVAASEGFLDMAELLLRRGAQINAASGKNTPLHVAVGNKHYEMVIFLLKSGANPNFQYYAAPRPLNVAAGMGDRRMVEILLAAGAEVNPVTSSTDYIAPIFDAVRSGNKEVVDLLIAKGADLSVTRYYLGDPLSYAVSLGHLEIVKDLLAKGVSVSASALEGIMGILTLNTQASSVKDVDLPRKLATIQEMLDLLLSRDGENINTALTNGCTLLHLAAAQKDPVLSEQLVRTLLARGANPNVTEMLGRKPRAFADEIKHLGVEQLLAAAEEGRTLPPPKPSKSRDGTTPDPSKGVSGKGPEKGETPGAGKPGMGRLVTMVVGGIAFAAVIMGVYFLVRIRRRGGN